MRADSLHGKPLAISANERLGRAVIGHAEKEKTETFNPELEN
jgi:hypothetical protein